MTTNPDSLLTREEFASLREIARGLIAKKVPPKHAEKLLKLHLIAKPRFEYVLTEAGEKRLVGK